MKKIISLCLSLFSCISAIAATSVQIDGVNYSINSSQHTATVLKSDFSGDLVIPDTIQVDGNNYVVTEIEKSAFQNSYGLTSVNLPKSIKTIGAKAFANGNEINVYISDMSSWCKITFGYTYSVSGGRYSYDPIADYRLFLDSTEIVELTIPDDITYIPVNTFSGCKSITKVSFHNNVTSIGDYAFYKCGNLANVDFGEGIWSIGEYSFCKCSSIETLNLPNSLHTIEIGALQSMDNLAELSIPGNVTEIESGCFLNDANLSSVRFEDSENDLTLGYGQYSGQPIFIGCPLKTIYIGRNLREKTQSSNTGYSVAPFKNQTGLTTVRVGENVKCLGSSLFSGCSSLSEINTPKSLEEIGSWCFDGCTSLPVINNIQYAGDCAISVIDKEQEVIEVADNTRFLLTSCFSGCKNMKTIDLPDSLIYWGDYMFSGCSNLLEIKIPSNVKKIGESMFYGCEKLSEVNIPSNISSIGTYAFEDCKSIKSIIIPQSVTGIHNDAFNGCDSLTNIKFEDSSENIGLGISGSNKSIFKDCPLEEVYIGRNIGMYYSSASSRDYLPFYNKATIKKLTIGAEVTNIWNYSFYGCSALESIYALPENPISLDSNTFSNSIYSTCKLYVLPNSISMYSTANVWRNFQNIVEYATSIQSIYRDQLNGDERIYDLNGMLGNQHSKIQIIKSKDGKTKKVLVK